MAGVRVVVVVVPGRIKYVAVHDSRICVAGPWTNRHAQSTSNPFETSN